MSNSANFKMDTRGIVNAVEDEDMATGDVKFWPSEVVPAGWIVRDGRALSRVAYAALFAVLGTRYGAGDGATTFNIPDDRAEFIRGADMGRGVDAGRMVGSLQSGSLAIADDGNDVNGLIFDGAAMVGAMGYDRATLSEYPGRNHTLIFGDNQYKGVYNNSTDYWGVTRPRNRAYVPLIKY